MAAIIVFGVRRIFGLYKYPPISRHEYLTNGFVLIAYATLIVGAASLLSASVSSYQLFLGKASYLWASIGLMAEYFRYLAPFVFAAVGVNFVSHAVVSKS